MDAKQRRMWVLPAPDGQIEKRDRYAIGIFYSFLGIIVTIIKPIKFIFESLSKKPWVFISKKGADVFISMRKTSRDT